MEKPIGFKSGEEGGQDSLSQNAAKLALHNAWVTLKASDRTTCYKKRTKYVPIFVDWSMNGLSAPAGQYKPFCWPYTLKNANQRSFEVIVKNHSPNHDTGKILMDKYSPGINWNVLKPSYIQLIILMCSGHLHNENILICLSHGTFVQKNNFLSNCFLNCHSALLQ